MSLRLIWSSSGTFKKTRKGFTFIFLAPYLDSRIRTFLILEAEAGSEDP